MDLSGPIRSAMTQQILGRRRRPTHYTRNPTHQRSLSLGPCTTMPQCPRSRSAEMTRMVGRYRVSQCKDVAAADSLDVVSTRRALTTVISKQGAIEKRRASVGSDTRFQPTVDLGVGLTNLAEIEGIVVGLGECDPTNSSGGCGGICPMDAHARPGCVQWARPPSEDEIRIMMRHSAVGSQIGGLKFLVVPLNNGPVPCGASDGPISNWVARCAAQRSQSRRGR